MIFSDLNWQYVLPGLILLVAGIDDLRSRKIHNKLILLLLPLVLIAVFWLKGISGLLAGGFSALLALVVGVPLTLGRVIGGGDLKLLVLLALTLNLPDFVWILVYSFPWALLLGVFKIILDKKFKDFVFNLVSLFRHRTTKGLEFHSIPFSFALFMAWLSFMTLQGLSIP